ncbi:hypothetical protein QQG55_13105 [Brugia pahangi]
MVIRPSIEKWSRQELEDHYHVLYQQHHSLKRSYNELESKLKQSNAKIKRIAISGKDDSNDVNYAELIKENRLLTNKLKNLKQQVLSYARPGISTQCLPSSQAHLPIKRPQSALPRKPQPLQQTANVSSQFVNIQQRPATDVQKVSDRKSLLLDKILFVKLNRELKQKDDECGLLKCKLNNIQQQLAKLKDEYDQLLEQFQSKENEGLKLQQQFDQLSLNATTDAKIEEQSKNIQIMEKELEMIREENRMLHEANEKLIQNSLMIEQLVVKEDKQQEMRNDQRILEMEKQLNELLVKYSQLKKVYQNLMETKLKLEERLNNQNDQKNSERMIVDKTTKQTNEYEKTIMENSTTNDKFNKADFNLVKIYEDLTRIIEAHIIKRSTDDDNIDDDHDNGDKMIKEKQEYADKWRIMYMEIYGELEKVRNMLLIQHNINEKHLQEIALLNQNLKQAKAHAEIKMKDLIVKLSEREAEIVNLQMQLKTLAYNEQMPISCVLTNEQEMEANEMILHLSRIVLSSNGMAQIGTLRPVIFLAIEFYDFELQTTPMLNGSDIRLDFSTIYDVIVSNLFLHYLETHGITIEMYQPRGTDYVLCSIGIISLKRLISINESYSGVLHMKSLHDGCLFATIEYDISINSKMINALILQKKKLTIVSMGALADSDESINQSMYNVLIVNIQRCANLDKLISDNYAPTTLISYELYDYDAWRTQSVLNSINPEYNSTKTWLLPTGNDLYNVLRSSHLTIVVLEKQTHSNEERQIGYVNIALYPLAHNNEISGTFPLHSMTRDIPTEASIDISISWKFPYHPPEPELELENVKRSIKTNGIVQEGKLINGWSNLTDSFNDNNESTSKKEIDGKIYELDDLPQKCHNNESQKVSPNLMESIKHSSMINDEFIATNEYFEGENFHFHIDSTNDIKTAMPKVIDIVDDKDDKMDNQLTNMEEMNEQHKSSILSEKRRKIPHAVEFADPIQEIFSPSTSSMDETINSWTGDDGQIIEDDISIISCKYSQLNEKLPDVSSNGFDKLSPRNNYIIELIIGSLHINDQSKLIDPLYDDQSIYIEWKLLDFPSEECETTGELLPLPRDTQTTADFNFQKSYALNNKQYYLLRQWIEHGNRLEINLVSNGNNLKSSEDLGVAYAELDAQYNAEKRLIQFTDINGIEVASIDISISYNKNLLEQLQGIGKVLENE